MSFKLAFKNMKKNMKDYVIYFITLVLGVAIFYIFNSMEAQQAALSMSESKQQIIELMVQALGIVSGFVTVVLGFLIVYANNFLIKRRKKEFGLYMLLGMGRRNISTILLLETFLIGIFSLAVGLIIGIFGSQLMSILVANMFEADMTGFKFVFSEDALVKTIMYFAIIYLLVMILNLFSAAKYKLIDLLNAGKKNERVVLRNPVISVILFIISIAVLAYAYYLAITEVTGATANGFLFAILLGIIGTFMFFYSLSGFALKLIQMNKNIYLKNLNIFVLRQTNSKINTTVFSMSIICLLLFFTICIFSSAMSLNNSLTAQLKTLNPADITITKQYNLPEKYTNSSGKVTMEYSEEQRKDSLIPIMESLESAGFDKSNFSDYVEIGQYRVENITPKETIGTVLSEMQSDFPALQVDYPETIIKVSDYNKLQKSYGREEITLNDNEYVMVCNYEAMKEYRDEALKNGTTLTIDGKEFVPKFDECIDTIISISTQPMETGTIILPDEAVKDEWKFYMLLSANYVGQTDDEKQAVENKLIDVSEEDSTVNQVVFENMTAFTKITNYEASVGISATVTFIGLYLGIIFLISSSAILALKELTDSSDNKERYKILRRIGADEKMINKALFKQIGIFFMIPLLLAIVHSIFGMKVASIILEVFGKQDIFSSIILTAIFMVLIYGGYFLATYFGSKSIIKEEN